MRTFEILLVAVNLLTLLLSFRRQAKRVWLGLAGVNLVVLLFHGIFEGYRYQMAFSYLLVLYAVILALTTLAKASRNLSNVRIPRVVRAVVISLAVVLLAMTSFVAYALPVFTLPKPTGEYATGVQYVALVDAKRTEPFLDHSTQPRRLMVKTFDHTYVSAATAFPDRIVTAHEATTNFDTPEPAAPITQIMADDDAFVIDQLGEMNDGAITPIFKGKLNLDAIGVIGHSVGGAVAYNLAINDSRVKAAIDLDGVVFVTPKEGKAIAPFLMLANDRYHVQAITKRQSLLQMFAPTPEGQQEMLMMYGSQARYDQALQQAQQTIIGLAGVLNASGNLYTIAGSDHMKFTDIGLFIGSSWLRELMNIRGQTEPARCIAITSALTVAFFDQHLKGQSAESWQPLMATYPELRKVNLN